MQSPGHESISPTQNRELSRMGKRFLRKTKGQGLGTVVLYFLREIRVIRGKGLLLIVLGAVFFSAGRAAAQGATPPAPVTPHHINHVAHQLYCPGCENTPFDVFPPQAS